MNDPKQIYALGVVIQMITGPGHALGPIVAGRLIAGLGVGFESAIVILYMSEIVSGSNNRHVATSNRENSAQEKSVVRSWLDTNFASPLVFCWPLASFMPSRTDKTPVPTAFQLPFNLPGPLS